MAPATHKRSKNAKKQQLKPQGKKISKIVDQVADKKKGKYMGNISFFTFFC